MAKYCVVYNPRAGFISSRKLLEDLFRRKRLDAVFIKCDKRINSVLAKEIANGAKVLVAAGGDGTVNTVVWHTVKSKLTLAVIPIGTYNHFAKDLKIPLEADKAVALIARGKTKVVDVASLNDKLFVNLSSIGVYPRMVSFRSRASHLIGKRLASFLAAVKAASWPRQYDLAFAVDGKRFSRKASLVALSNNSYEATKTGFANRQGIESGWLWLYIIKAASPLQLARLTIRTYLGKTDAERDFEEYTARRVVINLRGRKRKIAVAADGEVLHLSSPLVFSIKPKALRVITK
jgi:YegS/Rv2252/BmrU family lipid kinase